MPRIEINKENSLYVTLLETLVGMAGWVVIFVAIYMIRKAIKACLSKARQVYQYISKPSEDRVIATALQGDDGLASIVLPADAIGPYGAKLLAERGKSISSLVTIDLSNNPISDDGAVELAKAIPECKALRRLILTNCNIGSRGATALANSLAGLKLVQFSLEGNPISDDGAVGIALARLSVKDLNLRGCQIDDRGAIALANSLLNKGKVERLYIDDNPITREGLLAFVMVLRYNRILTHLLLPMSDLTTAEARIEILNQMREVIRSVNAIVNLQIPILDTLLEQLNQTRRVIRELRAVAHPDHRIQMPAFPEEVHIYEIIRERSQVNAAYVEQLPALFTFLRDGQAEATRRTNQAKKFLQNDGDNACVGRVGTFLGTQGILLSAKP